MIWSLQNLSWNGICQHIHRNDFCPIPFSFEKYFWHLHFCSLLSPLFWKVKTESSSQSSPSSADNTRKTEVFLSPTKTVTASVSPLLTSLLKSPTSAAPTSTSMASHCKEVLKWSFYTAFCMKKYIFPACCETLDFPTSWYLA